MNIVVGTNTDLSMRFFGNDLEHKRQDKFDPCSAAEDSEVRALALILVDIPSEVGSEVTLGREKRSLNSSLKYEPLGNLLHNY